MRRHVRLGLLLALVVALAVGRSTPSWVAASMDMFGDGSDGAKTYSTDTTDTPIDSPASGTVGTIMLSASNASFAPGQKILIHQSRGTNAGVWETNEIQSYSAGTITTVNPLAHSYTTSGASAAQVLVVPQYTSLTVNAGVTVTSKAWNGSTGGIFAVLVNGTATIDGTISANSTGYRGGQRGTQSGPGPAGNNDAGQGEGTAGAGATNGTYTRNGSGGGAGTGSSPLGGGGGGNGTAGGDSTDSGTRAEGGSVAGSIDLTTAVMGGGGGGTVSADNQPPPGNGAIGGNGGGIVFVFGSTITVGPAGAITANGAPGGNGNHGAGAGAGGSILLKTRTGTLGTNLVEATGGAGGLETPGSGSTEENGGPGGLGRIRVEYCDSLSGSTNPPASVTVGEYCAAAPVGGIAGLPGVSDSSTPNHIALAALAAAALVALAASAWYARRHRSA